MALKPNLRTIRVNTGSDDREGRLVLVADELVAVLVRLDGAEHGPLRGHWLLEAGFGPCAVTPAEAFASLDDARAWIFGRLDGFMSPQAADPSSPGPISRRNRVRNRRP